MINPTAKLLKKWLTEKYPTKDEDYIKWNCRRYWTMYGEQVIKRALAHYSCTNIGEFIRMCNYYKGFKPKKKRINKHGWTEITNG